MSQVVHGTPSRRSKSTAPGAVRALRSGGWGAVIPVVLVDTILFPPGFPTISLRQLPTLVDWMGTTRRMFHVKHPQSVLILSVLLATVLAGCAGTRSPEGWAAPTEAGDVTLVQEEPGVIAALTLSDSSAVVRWRVPADGQDDPDLTAIYGDPLIAGDRVYVAGYSGHVVALDLATGRPVDGWPSLDLPAHVVATPAMSDTHLFVATDRGRIVPIDLATGADSPAILDVGERIWSPLFMQDGTLYVAGLDRKVRALDPQTGAERWKAELGGSVAGEFTIEGGTIYVGAFDRRLYALDAGTGGERWSVSGDGWFWARPLVTADMLYAAPSIGSMAIHAGRRRPRKHSCAGPPHSQEARSLWSAGRAIWSVSIRRMAASAGEGASRVTASSSPTRSSAMAD